MHVDVDVDVVRAGELGLDPGRSASAHGRRNSGKKCGTGFYVGGGQYLSDEKP